MYSRPLVRSPRHTGDFLIAATRYNTTTCFAATRDTLQHAATRCNTLQHAATRCNTLQHTATRCNTPRHAVTRCNTLQHSRALVLSLRHTSKSVAATTHCNTLQHAALYCNTLQHTATHCNTLQHAARHCNTLQHTATHCNTLRHTATHCNTLQHAAIYFNTLQHTATHCNTRAPLFAVTDTLVTIPKSLYHFIVMLPDNVLCRINTLRGKSAEHVTLQRHCQAKWLWIWLLRIFTNVSGWQFYVYIYIFIQTFMNVYCCNADLTSDLSSNLLNTWRRESAEHIILKSRVCSHFVSNLHQITHWEANRPNKIFSKVSYMVVLPLICRTCWEVSWLFRISALKNRHMERRISRTHYSQKSTSWSFCLQSTEHIVFKSQLYSHLALNLHIERRINRTHYSQKSSS